MMELNKLYHGNCLEIMKEFPNNSIDMILCDLPYGVTACKWDKKIDLAELWIQYKRILKPRCSVVLTATQPFATDLINSNREWFKYVWYWKKNQPSNFIHAHNRPMFIVEEVLVFSDGVMNHENLSPNTRMFYYPQNLKRKKKLTYKNRNKKSDSTFQFRPKAVKQGGGKSEYSNYPNDFLEFDINSRNTIIYPTQKPVGLFEYLIKTYTLENQIVLDNCIGSGTTAIAAMNTNRNWIGIEKNLDTYNLANDRIRNHKK